MPSPHGSVAGYWIEASHDLDPRVAAEVARILVTEASYRVERGAVHDEVPSFWSIRFEEDFELHDAVLARCAFSFAREGGSIQVLFDDENPSYLVLQACVGRMCTPLRQTRLDIPTVLLLLDLALRAFPDDARIAKSRAAWLAAIR